MRFCLRFAAYAVLAFTALYALQDPLVELSPGRLARAGADDSSTQQSGSSRISVVLT